MKPTLEKGSQIYASFPRNEESAREKFDRISCIAVWTLIAVGSTYYYYMNSES